MDMRKCITELRNSARKSLSGGYKKDWADLMFRVYILKLLAKISKIPIKQKAEPEQETGKQRFGCASCKGDGYTEEWNDDETKKIIRDCSSCKGEGFVFKIVEDKRKVSKNKKLGYNEEY